MQKLVSNWFLALALLLSHAGPWLSLFASSPACSMPCCRNGHKSCCRRKPAPAKGPVVSAVFCPPGCGAVNVTPPLVLTLAAAPALVHVLVSTPLVLRVSAASAPFSLAFSLFARPPPSFAS